MTLLFDLIRFTARTTAQFVRSAVAKACLARVPPSNWNSAGIPSCNSANANVAPRYARSRIASETKSTFQRRSDRTWGLETVNASSLDREEYVDFQRFLEMEVLSAGSEEAIVLEDVPTMIETLRNLVDDTQVTEASESDDGDATLCSVDSHLIDFSIYSDVSSPILNKAMLISPARPTMLDVKDVNFTLLRAASERVSEILRENRRRLDAGEDPNIARKEARRKRAQELSAVRKVRDNLF